MWHAGLLRRRRDVLFGQSRSGAEKILLHLLHNHFLIFAASGIQAIFIQQHFAKLRPTVPSLLRDVVVDFFAQLGIERRLIESWSMLLQLDTKYGVFCHFSS